MKKTTANSIRIAAIFSCIFITYLIINYFNLSNLYSTVLVLAVNLCLIMYISLLSRQKVNIIKQQMLANEEKYKLALESINHEFDHNNLTRYKALVDNLPFCVHEINLEGQLISMNRGGLDMLGLSNESEIIGKKYLSFPDEKDKERVQLLLDKSFQGETSFFEFSTAKGTCLYSTCFIPLKDENDAVYRVFGYSHDITQQRRVEQDIFNQANYDDLTKLPNRNHLTRVLQDNINLAKQSDTHFALMFIDLDQFKEVNDSLGHPIGDELLVQVAERLVSCLPKDSFLARQGGDEFCALIYHNPKPSQLDQIAQQIIHIMNMYFCYTRGKFVCYRKHWHSLIA